MASSEWLKAVLVGALERIPDPSMRKLRDSLIRLRSGPRSPLTIRVANRAAHVASMRSIPADSVDLAHGATARFRASHNVILHRAYWNPTDAYEGSEIEWWQRACKMSSGALELGANVGIYSVYGALANPALPITSVEPHPVSAEELLHNLEVNGVNNVTVVRAAATSTRDLDHVTLTAPRADRYGTPTGAYVNGGEGVENLGERDSWRVPAVHVLDLVDGVDLVKLDIEGQESPILEAAWDWIVVERPMIFVEVRLAATDRLIGLVRRLCEAGYLALAIGTHSLHAVTMDQLSGDRPVPRYGTRDLILATPEQFRELLATTPLARSN